MALIDIVRKGVGIADKATKTLQSTVTYERSTGQDSWGKRTFASPVTLRAIVEYKQRQVRDMSGQMTISAASVLFLDIPTLEAATSGNGIDAKDRITLPDGRVAPILNVGGFGDPATHSPVASEIYLG